jgi:hypothetical protein
MLYNVRQEKGDGGGRKGRCDSDANDNEHQQEEEISCTNAPSFAAREHASSLTKKHTIINTLPLSHALL